MFYHMRQDDQRRRGTTIREEYGLVYVRGIPSTYLSATYTEPSVTLAKGSTRVMFYNNTGPFHPGGFSVNPVDQRKETLSCSSSQFTGYRMVSGRRLLSKIVKGDVGSYLGYAGNFGLTNPVPADDVLSTHLYEQALVESTQASSEVGVMIGEIEETAQMLINPINALAKILNGLRNFGVHKRRSRKHFATYLTDFWLVNRFGILPSLADIMSLCDSIRHKAVREWSPIMKKGKARRTVSRTDQGAFGNLYGYPVLTRNKITTTLVHRACVYYQRNYMEEGWQKYGVSLFQWPGVAWELIPLSFMVDRVIGIGNWLERIRPKYGHVHLGATISRKLVTSSVREALSVQDTTSSTVWSPCGQFTRRESELYFRDTPGPLSTSVPLVNINLSGLIKTMDHVSLAWQRLPRLHKL